MNRNENELAVIATYGGPLNVDVGYKRSWLGQKGVLSKDHLPKFHLGKLAGMTLAVDTLDDIRMFFMEIDESEDQIELVETGSEIEQAMARGHFPVILCASYKVIGEDAGMVPFLRKLGVRLFSLSTNVRNLLADGCGERSASGLSYLGLEVVQRLEQSSILPDVSHLSDVGFWDLYGHTSGPIVATHSNARTLCDTPRNLDDNQLKAIAERDGLVGISTYPTLVAENHASLENLLDHIDYLVDQIGIEHVAIGTDFVSFIGSLFDAKLAQADPDGKLYKDYGTSMLTEGIGRFEQVVNLVDGLVRRGYEGECLEKILSKNYIRLLDRS
jgi:membrane dipeptidase